jgi:hypothetical protein
MKLRDMLNKINPLESVFEIGNKLLDRVIEDPSAKQKAHAQLHKIIQSGELARLIHGAHLLDVEQKNLTQRTQADMGSDSWLSKNIRPMTLFAMMIGYFIFCFISVFGYHPHDLYIEVLEQWGMLIMSFYFGGRTIEKIIAIKQKPNIKDVPLNLE